MRINRTPGQTLIAYYAQPATPEHDARSTITPKGKASNKKGNHLCGSDEADLRCIRLQGDHSKHRKHEGPELRRHEGSTVRSPERSTDTIRSMSPTNDRFGMK